MTAPPQQISRVAAYGLLWDEDRILLCRISGALPQDRGRWTLPGGGLEFGEDPADAMVREVHEETGYLVRPDGLLGVDSLLIEGKERSYHGIRIIYRAVIVGGALRPEVNGSTDLAAWWPREAIADLDVVDLVDAGLQMLAVDAAPPGQR